MNKSQKFLIDNKCNDLILNDKPNLEPDDYIYASDLLEKFRQNQVQMGLICPNCGTFLKFCSGHNPDLQLTLPPHELCPKCNFMITYERKDPSDISGLMEKKK